MRTLLLFLLLTAQTQPFAGLREEWASDLHEKNVDASVALYAPNAVFVQPDGTRVQGTAALRDLYRKVTSTFDSTLAFSPREIETSGDLAYDSGTYTETLVTRATGQKTHMAGSYLTVYRKDKDAGWKIVEQVWTGGPASGAAAQ
jgi:ketosteroid isomerase-like protein